jgi:DNA-binding CsgD family transcriptional regulator
MIDPERLSQLLLELYRASTEVPANQFLTWAFDRLRRDLAFDRLRRDLAFDSGIWVSGAAGGAVPVLYAMHLDRQPTQMLVDYEQVRAYDSIFPRVMAQQGRAIRADALAEMPEHCWPYLQRYGLALGLCVLKIDPLSGLLNSMTLYRSDAQQRFSNDDAALLEAVFPHLRVVDRVSKMQRFKQEAGASAATVGGFAACDATGELRYVDEAFKALLVQAWPTWRGPQLPTELCALLQRRKTSVSMPGGLVASSQPYAPDSGVGSDDGWLLHLREGSALDALPARLRQVAQALLDGKSHKQIAKELDLAPATVRNHMATLNSRLGVSGRAELAAKLRTNTAR